VPVVICVNAGREKEILEKLSFEYSFLLCKVHLLTKNCLRILVLV